MNPLAFVDILATPKYDRLILKAIGLVASGSLILLWAGLKLTPKKIGA